MKPVIFAVFCLLLSTPGLADTLIRQTYAIDKVTEIHARNASRLEIRQGPDELLYVEGTADALEYAQVNLDGGRLSLGHEHRQSGFWGWLGAGWKETNPVTFYIQVKDLSLLDLSGATKTRVSGLNAKALELRLSGASEVTLDGISLQRLQLDVSGASRLSLNGLDTRILRGQATGASQVEAVGHNSSDHVDINVSGASKFRGEALLARAAEARISGASHVELRVSESLDVEVSGASHVHYYGNPRLKERTSGASSVKHRGD